jgi:rhamnose transport system permease protein
MTRLRPYASELLLVVLIVLAAIASSAMSPYFLDPTNLLSAAQFFVIFALMAFGLFPIVVQGEIDISLASTLAIGSVLFATLAVSGVPVVAAVALVLAGTAVLGVVNGILVGYAGLPSLAVTLGALGAYRGLAYLLAGDAGVTKIPPEYLLFGATTVGPIPLSLVLVLAVAAGFTVLMGATAFGRYSYAIGSSPAAARMAAVPVNRVRVLAYAVGGAMAGLAGIVWVSQYQSARGDNADGAILFVLTAVVLGGISIKGGSGRAVGVLLATVLLGTIQTGMKLANVPGTSQTLVVGALLIGAVGLPRVVSLLRQRLGATSMPKRAQGGGQA